MYFTVGPLRVMEREMRQRPGSQSSNVDNLEDYNILLGRMLYSFHNPAFAQKAWQAYHAAPVRVFSDARHRLRFICQFSPFGLHTSHAVAALYLLTADEILWQQIYRDAFGITDSFPVHSLCRLSSDLLYQTAKNLYEGILPEMLISSLPEQMDSQELLLILTAFLFQRHGFTLLRYDGRSIE